MDLWGIGTDWAASATMGIRTKHDALTYELRGVQGPGTTYGLYLRNGAAGHSGGADGQRQTQQQTEQ